MAKLAGKNGSGIYGIFNLINGKVYIGSAVNLKKRIFQHKFELIQEKHINEYLQNSWNKYGELAFEFYIIEYCPKENLIEREQFYMDALKVYNAENGYNICQTAGSTLGQKPMLGKNHSKETKGKMSISQLCRFKNPFEKAKIILRNLGNTNWLGKKHTNESKMKISEGNKGKIINLKTRTAISLSNKKRIKFPFVKLDRIKWFHDDGMTYRELAKMFSCGMGVINSALKKGVANG